MFATEETMDLEMLPRYWQEVDSRFDRLRQLPDLSSARMLTARAFDQSQPAGIRAYMEAQRFLGVALDNHKALVALLEQHGAIVWAPYSLMRPIFETSFFAAWILDPDDGRDRRLRGLRCEVRDALEQRRHLQSFQAVPEVRNAIATTTEGSERVMLAYQAEAAAIGEPWDKVHQRVNVTEELPRLSSISSGNLAPFMVATWRMLSGYEHGLGWASLRGSDMKRVADVPGGANVELKISDNAFVLAGKATYFLLVTACRLFERRHTTR